MNKTIEKRAKLVLNVVTIRDLSFEEVSFVAGGDGGGPPPPATSGCSGTPGTGPGGGTAGCGVTVGCGMQS